MASIGETLREARMRQRLDIADVEERTKIRAKYLRALENEEFGMLPGATFVKTFLRTYAEALGLDPHLLVEEYRATYEPRDESEAQPITTTPARERRPRERRFAGGGGGGPGPGTIVAGAVVGILVVILVLGLTANDKGSKQAADTTQTTQKKRVPKKKAKPKPKPAPGLATLQITPNGPVYLCVDRGLGKAVVYNGTTSDPQTFKGRKLRLNLGRTAVAIKFNGKDFKVPQVANPVGYEFSPTGSKELPQGQRPTCA
jgi:cytoskeleton protein RodZ